MLFQGKLHTLLETTFLGLVPIPEAVVWTVVEFHVFSLVRAGGR